MTEAVGQQGPCTTAGMAEEQRAIVERLRACLDALATTHDLTRRDIRATERAIRRLDRHGMAPAANEFWATTCRPRAQRLLVESRHVIERDLLCLRSHAARGGNRLAVTYQEVIGALVAPDRIDDLGRWWQQRLRRAAIVRSAAAVAGRPPSQTELIVAHHEMALLDRAPWAHGDRLLSAFELVHAEVGRFGKARVESLFAELGPGRPEGPAPLVTNGR